MKTSTAGELVSKREDIMLSSTAIQSPNVVCPTVRKKVKRIMPQKKADCMVRDAYTGDSVVCETEKEVIDAVLSMIKRDVKMEDISVYNISTPRTVDVMVCLKEGK